MLSFCGQDKSLLDANGRIKLSPRVISDFKRQGGLEVVLHCLPEGALALYPEDVYLRMRNHEPNPAERAASSLVFRRSMRRFGAMSRSEVISNQGRVTLPEAYRDHADIQPGSELMVVGCEIGVELWNPERWRAELGMIGEHEKEKGDLEMSQDLGVRGGVAV